MPVNISPKVRFALYILGALSTPLIAYLFDRGTIGTAEVTLCGAYLALVNLLAASKTDTSSDQKRILGKAIAGQLPDGRA